MRGMLLFAIVSASLTAQGQELKDPHTRDEDISHSQIDVQISRDSTGLYHYVYTVVSNMANKGTISGLEIDLWCDLPKEPVTLPELGAAEGHLGNLSFDGQHIPAVVRATCGSAFDYGISSHNTADWGLLLKPGQKSSGLEIISPAPPALRHYSLWPSMNADGWNYTDEMAEDPNVPWVPDFVVTGQIQGPSCGTLEELFLGTSNPSENPKVNSLLAYGVPLRDRFHTTADELTMTIHYSPDIDPTHFHVEPANYRHYFHVAPGTVETVTLPLVKSKNKIKLQAQARNGPGRARDKSEDESASRNDVDVFEIRVDSGTPKRNAK